MEKMILSNVNVVVWGQVKSENSSLSVGVRVSETRVLKSHWLQISRIAGQVRKIENPETLPQERF